MTSTAEAGTTPGPTAPTTPADPNVVVLPRELIMAIKQLHRHDAQHDAYEALAEEAKERMTNAYAEGKEKEASLHRDQFRSLTKAAEQAREDFYKKHREVLELKKNTFPQNTPCSLHTWTLSNDEGMHQLVITAIN